MSENAIFDFSSPREERAAIEARLWGMGNDPAPVGYPDDYSKLADMYRSDPNAVTPEIVQNLVANLASRNSVFGFHTANIIAVALAKHDAVYERMLKGGLIKGFEQLSVKACTREHRHCRRVILFAGRALCAVRPDQFRGPYEYIIKTYSHFEDLGPDVLKELKIVAGFRPEQRIDGLLARETLDVIWDLQTNDPSVSGLPNLRELTNAALEKIQTIAPGWLRGRLEVNPDRPGISIEDWGRKFGGFPVAPLQ